MDHLKQWLNPLFKPISEWVLFQMKAEQKRLQLLTIERMGGHGDDDQHLDDQVIGFMARLDEYFIVKEGNKPEYIASRSGVNGMWYVLCIATLQDGSKL